LRAVYHQIAFGSFPFTYDKVSQAVATTTAGYTSLPMNNRIVQDMINPVDVRAIFFNLDHQVATMP
jgi:uncharacterized membrane protein